MMIFDKKIGDYIPFKLWKRQVEFLDFIHIHKKVVFLKKRQVGGSQLVGADSLAHCLFIDNYTVLVLSKTSQDADEFLRRVIDMYKSVPGWDSGTKTRLTKQTSSELELGNGSRIISLSANRGGRGMTADRIVLDEGAFFELKSSRITLDEVLKHCLPAVEKANGQIIIISTANGMNYYHSLYKKGETGETGWHSFFFSCYDDETFTKEMREKILIDEGEAFTFQEYPENATQAFLATGSQRFNVPILMQSIENAQEGEYGRFTLNKTKNAVIFEPGDGVVEVWKHPEWRPRYCIGVDVAEGIDVDDGGGNRDWSVATVIEVESCEQVAQIRCRYEPEAFAEEVYRLGMYYNQAFLVVESNGHGITVLRYLKDKYPPTSIYYAEMFDEDTQVRRKKMGWNTNTKTRPVLIDELDEFIRKEWVTINSSVTIDECMTFIRKSNGKCEHESGCHDDCVFALALAIQGRKYMPRRDEYEDDGYESFKERYGNAV